MNLAVTFTLEDILSQYLAAYDSSFKSKGFEIFEAREKCHRRYTEIEEYFKIILGLKPVAEWQVKFELKIREERSESEGNKIFYIVSDSSYPEYNFAVNIKKKREEDKAEKQKTLLKSGEAQKGIIVERKYFVFTNDFAPFMEFFPMAELKKSGSIFGQIFELGDHIIKIGMFKTDREAVQVLVQIQYKIQLYQLHIKEDVIKKEEYVVKTLLQPVLSMVLPWKEFGVSDTDKQNLIKLIVERNLEEIYSAIQTGGPQGPTTKPEVPTITQKIMSNEKAPKHAIIQIISQLEKYYKL